MTSKELTIISVSYNAFEYTDKWIASILEHPTHCSFEIIIVDNGSSKETLDKIKKIIISVGKKLDLKLITCSTNLGFAKANNIAFSNSNGKFILFMNNDTLLAKDSIDKLLAILNLDKSIGIAGPKLLNQDLTFQPQCKRGIPTIWNSFCYILKLYILFPKSIIFGQYLQTYIDENEIADVPAISGACMMIRRDIFRLAGGFDERYFMYFEDIDLCMRVKEIGFRVVYYPKSEIIHYKSRSSSGGAKSKKYFYDSMLNFYEKNLEFNYNKVINLLVKKLISFMTRMAK